MADRKLYKVTASFSGYVLAESKEEAAKFADAIQRDEPRYVKAQFVYPSWTPMKSWQGDDLVYSDDLEELALEDVWPQ